VFTRDIGHDAPAVNFAYMFETMSSSLRSITIQAHNLRLTPLLDKDPKAAVLPALTFLRLEKCDAVTVEWVKQFVQALKDEGRWDGFKRLEVFQCHSLSKESLGFIASEKLYYVA